MGTTFPAFRARIIKIGRLHRKTYIKQTETPKYGIESIKRNSHKNNTVVDHFGNFQTPATADCYSVSAFFPGSVLITVPSESLHFLQMATITLQDFSVAFRWKFFVYSFARLVNNILLLGAPFQKRTNPYIQMKVTTMSVRVFFEGGKWSKYTFSLPGVYYFFVRDPILRIFGVYKCVELNARTRIETQFFLRSFSSVFYYLNRIQISLLSYE